MSLASPAHHEIDVGDANGDRRVNIQDVQIVIAEILQGSRSNHDGDVNGDGRVDVLDFQVVLHRATQARAQQEWPPADAKSHKAVLTTKTRSLVSVENRAVVVRVDRDDAPASFSVNSDPLVVFSPKTERYLFSLTAHAPPTRS